MVMQSPAPEDITPCVILINPLVDEKFNLLSVRNGLFGYNKIIHGTFKFQAPTSIVGGIEFCRWVLTHKNVSCYCIMHCGKA